MALRNTEETWGWLSRLFHWVMAGVLIFMLGLGFYTAELMTGVDFDSLTARFELVQLHKSWGFVAFTLVLARLIWRAVNPTPRLPDSMSAREQALARLGHAALYLSMIAMPVTGWLMVSASPYNNADAYPAPVKNMVFGWFELPDPFQPGSEPLTELLHNLHFAIGLVLTVLVLGHIAVALKHHFQRRDGVLMRMIRGSDR